MTIAQLHEENLAKVMAHLRAEFSNDIDEIMGTVAPDPRFFIVTREHGKLELEVAETPAAVRDHYVNLRTSLDVVRSRQIRRIAGEWFVFQQSVATMRTRAGADDRSADPHDFGVDTAVLFPIAAGGILGEIPWNRTSFGEAMSTAAIHHEPPTEELMETVDLHEAFLGAWCAGDERRVVDLLEDDCALGIRNCTDARGPMCVGEGKDAIRTALAEQFRRWRPATFTVVNLVVTDWYIFANVRWIGEAPSESGRWSPHETSTATILPISGAQRFRAILGYGTPLVPLESPNA
jgi:ketosteroid isomerase-like protein